MALRRFEPAVGALIEETYAAGELRRITGLSYRQINHWDRRGVLAGERSSEVGWRKFTALDMMSIRIIADLREHFGVPLDSLKGLHRWMIGAEDFRSEYRVRKAVTAGGELSFIRSKELSTHQLDDIMTCLTGPLTSKSKDVLFRSHDEIESAGVKACIRRIIQGLCPLIDAYIKILEGHRVYLAWNTSGMPGFVDEFHLNRHCAERGIREPVLLLPVNNSVNHVLKSLEMKTARIKYDATKMEPGRVSTPKDGERLVIAAIRNRETSSVTVETKNGEIIAFKETTSKDTSRCGSDEVIKMITDKDYQTITAKMANGKVLRLERTKRTRFPLSASKKSRGGAGKPSRAL